MKSAGQIVPLFSKLKIANKKKIGDHYESVAKRYLLNRGLLFLDQNYRAKCGEIDLIFKQGNTFVFVEVKYRKNSQFGSAVEMVTLPKMKKLIKTANHWLQHHNYSACSSSYRFDVIAIEQDGHDINWIQNAITEG